VNKSILHFSVGFVQKLWFPVLEKITCNCKKGFYLLICLQSAH